MRTRSLLSVTPLVFAALFAGVAAIAAPAQPGPLSLEKACGAVGQPNCPMQAWMKSSFQGPMASNDFTRLEASFEKLVKVAPPAFEGWAAISKAGAKAAAAKDARGVAAACKDCHERHRARYRAERRDAAL